MTRFAASLLVPVLVVGSACTVSTPAALYGQEEVLVLEVAPERVACLGEMEGMCLQVRSSAEEAWRKFYDPIDGFEYQEGIRYTIEVSRREILNPPADASAYEYQLIRILDQQPAGG